MMESRPKWAPLSGGVVPALLLLLAVAPGRAAAELPLLSLPAKGVEAFHTDMLAGTDEVGLGLNLPFFCTAPADGLALEVRQGFLRSGLTVDAAYYLRLTPESHVSGPEGFNLAMQLGLHAHTASRYRDDAGVGPALGFSVSRLTRHVPWGGYLEGFLGVQAAPVLAPGSARLDVPVRGSVGLQGRVCDFHLMLVGRGGYDDLRSQWGARPTFDATFAVGVGLF
jgi:hypothetical protein